MKSEKDKLELPIEPFVCHVRGLRIRAFWGGSCPSDADGISLVFDFGVPRLMAKQWPGAVLVSVWIGFFRSDTLNLFANLLENRTDSLEYCLNMSEKGVEAESINVEAEKGDGEVKLNVTDSSTQVEFSVPESHVPALTEFLDDLGKLWLRRHEL